MASVNTQAILYASARVGAGNSAAPPAGFLSGGFTALTHVATGHYRFDLEDPIDPQEVVLTLASESGATAAGLFLGAVFVNANTASPNAFDNLDVWIQDHANANADGQFTLKVEKVRVRGTAG